jgi:hypothetical protein
MFLVEFVKDLVISLVWWVILTPIVYIGATPFLLIVAATDGDFFCKSVRRRYGRLTRFWVDKGLLYIPF